MMRYINPRFTYLLTKSYFTFCNEVLRHSTILRELLLLYIRYSLLIIFVFFCLSCIFMFLPSIDSFCFPFLSLYGK